MGSAKGRMFLLGVMKRFQSSIAVMVSKFKKNIYLYKNFKKIKKKYIYIKI